MSRKIKDLTVKMGTYTDREGNTKGRYENVGSVMQGDDGGEFIMLKRTFNPAGVPNPDNRDSVLISAFDVKPREGGYSKPANGGAPVAGDMDDSIPFFREFR
jgi:hypothetical protein